MIYPTPCALKGCTRYINLDKPIPSNVRFICPECEDMIVASLMQRMEKVGIIADGNAEWIVQNVKLFRHEMRKARVAANGGLTV